MLRKQRIELEVQVKEMEGRLEQAEGEDSKVLEKERRKVEKLKEGVREWQVTVSSSFIDWLAVMFWVAGGSQRERS